MALMTSAGTCLPPGSVVAQHYTQHVLPVASTPSTASAFMQAVRHALPRHSIATSAIQANVYATRQERRRVRRNMLATVSSPDADDGHLLATIQERRRVRKSMLATDADDGSSSSNGHSNGHGNRNGMPEHLSLAHSNGNPIIQDVAQDSMNNGSNFRAAQAPTPHTSMEGAYSTASLHGHSQYGVAGSSSSYGTWQGWAAASSSTGTGHDSVAGSSASRPVRQSRTHRPPKVGRQYQTKSAGSSSPFQYNPLYNSLGVSSSLHPGAQVQLMEYGHGAVAVASESTFSAALAADKLEFDSIPASHTPPACQSSLNDSWGAYGSLSFNDSWGAYGSLFLDPLPSSTGELAAPNMESECISAASNEPVVPDTPNSMRSATGGSGASMASPVSGSTEIGVSSGEVALAMSQAPSKSAAARSKAGKGRQSKVKDEIASETAAERSAAATNKGRGRKQKSETEAAGSDVAMAQEGETSRSTSLARNRGRPSARSKSSKGAVPVLSEAQADLDPSGTRGISTSAAAAAAAVQPMSAAAEELAQKDKEAEDEAGRLIMDVFIVTRANQDDAAKLYKAMRGHGLKVRLHVCDSTEQVA